MDGERTTSGGGEGTALEEVVGGRYRLVGKIGSGGMAVVYVAKDPVLGRKVAVKRLHADSPDHAARRFLREAKVAAALNHPNLVTVFDAFPAENNLVIVMEYIEGPDLGEVLASGPLPETEAVAVLRDVAAALDHIHERGVVHRDVKPSNVLLAPDGRARLTDLGIARVLEETSTTQTNVVLGSAPYMSPEQLAGERVGPPADVYALALTAYEVLSGHRARSGSAAAMSYQAAVQPPPDVRDVRPETPPAVAAVLRRGLARSPRERPASCSEFVAQLERALSAGAAPGEAPTREPTEPFPMKTEEPQRSRDVAREATGPSTLPRPSATPADSRRLSRALLAGLAALLLVAIAIVAITSEGDGDGGSPGSTASDSRAERGGKGADEQPGGSRGAVVAPAGSPAAAVQDFYEAAADHDYTAAEALASESLLAQLGGAGSLAGTFGTLRSIRFKKLRTISESTSTAEVAVETIARHANRVDECSGTVTLVSVSETWLMDQLHIDCA